MLTIAGETADLGPSLEAKGSCSSSGTQVHQGPSGLIQAMPLGLEGCHADSMSGCLVQLPRHLSCHTVDTADVLF